MQVGRNIWREHGVNREAIDLSLRIIIEQNEEMLRALVVIVSRVNSILTSVNPSFDKWDVDK